MLFVAGILEGGFRQLVASTPWRFAIGWPLARLWIAYLAAAEAAQNDDGTDAAVQPLGAGILHGVDRLRASAPRDVRGNAPPETPDRHARGRAA